MFYHIMGLNARKHVFGVCEQQRRRPACTSAQSDQRLCYSLIGILYLDLLQAKFQFSSCSLAEETGLSLALSETPKAGFDTLRLIYELGGYLDHMTRTTKKSPKLSSNMEFPTKHFDKC